MLPLLMEPKSMQQIAVLIMLVYSGNVNGIRNEGNVGNEGAIVDYESFSTPYNEDPVPSQPLTESSNTNARQSSSPFRPSQMIEFTPSDATALKRFPPSYLEPNYHTMHIDPHGSNVRHDLPSSQFAFPRESEQSSASSAIVTKSIVYNNNNNNNNNAFIYHHNPAAQQTQSPVPPQLQTTPILIYRDPYTNELNNHQLPYQQVQQSHRYQQPQEYTVQSTLLVGADQMHPSSGKRDQKRPGYVFDEQLSPSYTRPIYAPNKPAAFDYQQQQPQQQRERLSAGNDDDDASSVGTHLSYDSHDYPPPSYYQQQTSNFQSPQRQDTAPNYTPAYTPQTTTTTTTTAATINGQQHASSNYANKFGNYLQGEKQQKQYQQPSTYQGNFKRPPPHYSNDVQFVAPRPPQQSPAFASSPYPVGIRPPLRPTPPPAPNYSNYYEYQLGEIPPPVNNYRPLAPGNNYRPTPPPYRPLPADAQSGGGGGGIGLASLASLFTSTQQYAPQFTNLLLSGLANAGAGGAGNGGGGRPGRRPLNMQLIKAMENIARNDDLQCVPKVLCQMIAGQTQRGQLPSFVTSPAITNFLAGFPASSPALIYGRAALLGISGGESSCTQTYAKCPKNEYEILHYLNNHRGGFFKFFSEPEEQPKPPKQSSTTSNDDSTSLFSLFSALTGGAPPTTTTPRPKPQPTLASFDITNGIGSFFNNVLSEYLGGVEYQRRRRRRRDTSDDEESTKEEITDFEDFHDEEDDLDTDEGVDFVDPEDNNDDNDVQLSDVEGRILHKEHISGLKFFPQDSEQADNEGKYLRTVIDHFNRAQTGRKLKFPSATDERLYEPVNEGGDTRTNTFVNFKDDSETAASHVSFGDDKPKDTRRGKGVIFKERPLAPFSPNPNDIDSSGHVLFPDHYEKHIRKGRIVNHPYADGYAGYVRYQDNDRFVISNSHRPRLEDSSNTYSNHNYNNAFYSQSTKLSQSQYSSNTNIYNRFGGNSNLNSISDANRYRPIAADSYDSRPSYSNAGSNANYNYPNSNYVSSNRYSSRYQTPRTTRAAVHEDDKNIYVTNSQGVTTYFITPDGRKVPI